MTHAGHTGTPVGTATPDPASHRDPVGRVHVSGDAVYRTLDATGAAEWHALRESGLYDAWRAEGSIVETVEAAPGGPTDAAPPAPDGGIVLRHERVPVITYAYEWPFTMLRDAALLQLRLTEQALEHGLVFKDATPYNIQWAAARPVLIDVASVERYEPGRAWAGYRQFCQLFLYPLMLAAYRGIDYRPLLRGRLDGIEPQQMARMLGRTAMFRRGVTTHVLLHARLDRRLGGGDGQAVRDIERGAFTADLLLRTVRRMHALVERLHVGDGASTWSDYAQACHYPASARQAKHAFVDEALARQSPRLVWDLGCNDGEYSRVAAARGAQVVALDADATVVDALAQALRAEPAPPSIVPLAVDVADPSPATGWRSRERASLPQRAPADSVLCLGLVHHLVASASIPFAQIVDWLAELAPHVVLEIPDEHDPLVQRLRAGRRSHELHEYGREAFERMLRTRFEVVRSTQLPEMQRWMYDLRRTGADA